MILINDEGTVIKRQWHVESVILNISSLGTCCWITSLKTRHSSSPVGAGPRELEPARRGVATSTSSPPRGPLPRGCFPSSAQTARPRGLADRVGTRRGWRCGSIGGALQSGRCVRARPGRPSALEVSPCSVLSRDQARTPPGHVARLNCASEMPNAYLTYLTCFISCVPVTRL